MRAILDVKYKNADLHKFMETWCQILTITQRNKLLKLLQISEELFDGLNLKFFEHFIEANDGPFKGSTPPMVDLSTYIFKYLNTGKITFCHYQR